MMDQFENKPVPYVNWSTQQLISWLEGLDDPIKLYIPEIEAKGLNGKWINSVTPGELQKLGVVKVGHQMLFMDRIRQLQTQYISFDSETLQAVLFRVSRQCTCINAAVGSLMSITERQDSRDPISDSAYPGIADDLEDAVTYILRCVLSLMAAVLQAAFWLERPPFLVSDLGLFRHFLLESALHCNRCAKSAIADQENSHFKTMIDYVDPIRNRVEEFIQNYSDSILLTPCTMEFVQLRKPDGGEFGFNFDTGMHNVHVILSVQSDSPASRSGMVNKGDEIVEINDQIVIGWQHHRVAELFRLHPKRITLRLRKRPAHASDFTGLPGGGRRHRLANANHLSTSVLPQHTRTGYLFNRTPRRRTALPSELTSETLSSTPESSSRKASANQLATIHSPRAQSSSSSSSLCPYSKANDLSHTSPTDSMPSLRMASSTPNTPLMTVRGTPIFVDGKKLSEPNLGPIDSSVDSPILSQVSITRSDTQDATTSSPNALPLPRFFPTHRRATSGDPNLFSTMTQPDRQAVPRLQALDKRSRRKSAKDAAEPSTSPTKFTPEGKKPGRKTSCKELGQGDCQGWLWLKKSSTLTNKYVKRWCVFQRSTLYYFRDPETEAAAEGSVCVLGFTIAPAAVVKSGRYPFYIFNDSARYTFASDTEVDRSKWLNILGLAAIGVSPVLRGSRIGGFGPGYIPSDSPYLVGSNSSISTPSLPAATESVIIVPTTSSTKRGHKKSYSCSKQDVKFITTSKTPHISMEFFDNPSVQSLCGASDSGSNLSLSSTTPSSAEHIRSAPWKGISTPPASQPHGDQIVEATCESKSGISSEIPSSELSPGQSHFVEIKDPTEPRTKLSEISIPSAVSLQPEQPTENVRRHSLSPAPHVVTHFRKTNLVRRQHIRNPSPRE